MPQGLLKNSEAIQKGGDKDKKAADDPLRLRQLP